MKTQVLKKPAFRELDNGKATYLSNQELQQLSTMPHNKRHDYLAGRYVVKTLCASMLPGVVHLPDFSVTYIQEKPYISYAGRNYYCSISHSKEYVACAIDESEQVGIDVEDIKPRSREFEEYIVSAPEVRFFDPDDVSRGTRAWSIKEAAFKSDREQILLNKYILQDRNKDIFLVENQLTKQTFRVKNNLMAGYTVSYTISHTQAYL